jgi:SAM-dependent methyltransferase
LAHEFDQGYWDTHWTVAGSYAATPPNPHLVREVGELPPGTALEAGCGEGAEAIWLSSAGWTVTAVDIAVEPLTRARKRASARGLSEDAVRWLKADLSTWEPSERFDLVTTHYAHPAMPQLEFYDRLSQWVAPGGSLLIVGHLHHDHLHHDHLHHDDLHHDRADHEHGPPPEASVTADRIRARLDPAGWDVVTAAEGSRTVDAPDGREVTLHDVVVRAVRRSAVQLPG